MPNSLIHANFFFVDIVGLSEPSNSTKSQVKKINILNKYIAECKAYSSTPKEKRILNSTGDGVWIGFLQGPELPLLLAIQLQEKLTEYNKSKIPSETLHVRIGLHNGICYEVEDIEGNLDVWGPGIILARRVMDIGNDGHILLSPRLAQDLIEISDEFSNIIYPVQDYTVKHGVTMLIYSAYGERFGNSKPPTKDRVQKSKMSKAIDVIQKTTLYPNVRVQLTVKNSKTMLVHHARTYDIVNISDEPIRHLLHGIGTDIEKKSLEDLNVKVYENNGSKLKISSINMDLPHTKEFTTVFENPVLRGEKDRQYTLDYEVEEPERYFENTFLLDGSKFSLTFSYPKESPINTPKAFSIIHESEEKIPFKILPEINEKENSIVVKWSIDSTKKGTAIRIEW